MRVAIFSGTTLLFKSHCLEPLPLLIVGWLNTYQERRLRMDISCFWRNRQICHLFALQTRLPG